MTEGERKEIGTTQRWGLGIIVTIAIASVAFLVNLGNIQQQVLQNKADIEKNEMRLDALDDKIERILIGIEQLKARLGIVEGQ